MNPCTVWTWRLGSPLVRGLTGALAILVACFVGVGPLAAKANSAAHGGGNEVSVVARYCPSSVDRTFARPDLAAACTFPADGVPFALETGVVDVRVTDGDGLATWSDVPGGPVVIRADRSFGGVQEPVVFCFPDAGGGLGVVERYDAVGYAVALDEAPLFCEWYALPGTVLVPVEDPACHGADPPAGQAYLYTEPKFGGACEAFAGHDRDLGDNLVGANTVGSVKVGSGVRLMLCVRPDYGGACSVLVHGYSYGDPVAGLYHTLDAYRVRDEQASLKVIPADAGPEPNEVILYGGPNFGGDRLFLGMGAAVSNLSDTVLGAAGARSARVGSGAVATLCEGLEFSDCVAVSGDAADLTAANGFGTGRAMSAQVAAR